MDLAIYSHDFPPHVTSLQRFILLIPPGHGAMSGTKNMLNFEYSIPKKKKKKKKIGGNFHQKVLKVRK
jgi:hypothetical protein